MNQVVHVVKYGGFWLRFVAYIIDLVIANILCGPLLLLFLPSFAMKDIDPMTPVPIDVVVNLVVEALWASLIFVCLIATYEAVFTASKMMATPGKYLLGLVVVDERGKQISFWRGISRHAAKAVSALLLCIGFIMVAFDKRKQGLHDKMVNTLVIKRQSLDLLSVSAE